MAQKNALGRGLGALIDGVEKEKLGRRLRPTWRFRYLQLKQTLFSRGQRFDEAALESWPHQSGSWGLSSHLPFASRAKEDTSSSQEREG
ncbi:MAG: hypothetical protein R2744_06600 [Bacteroidales bacterium]